MKLSMTEVLIVAVVTACLMLTFLCVFYQDIKSREVHVILLLSAFLFSWLRQLFLYGWEPRAVVNICVNIAFVCSLFALVCSYAILRYKIRLNAIWRYLGEGDVLFWLSIVPLFFPHEFFLHFVASLFTALLLHYCLRVVKSYSPATIPLAGFQSLYMAVVLIAKYFE